ncbi:hypothetical protein [Haloarcula sp. 1CSR25-25]|uniref:hypothetical protein n=1 Tax=Haloarcula sp. 1CSR25-25 TaxID=2862545 RepID=UPI002893EAF8|nr:hypothetical protein [Haloarcula sp. 1CSR25-25]MDT3434231.1 hypothetical protein [Haloarcula sp. 1CSR25-25]
MTLRNLFFRTLSAYHREGIKYLGEAMVRKARYGYRRWMGTYRGQSVYEDDWDALLLLDACRPDALRAVASEYNFIPEDVPVHYSVGSSSASWMRRTFTDRYQDEIKNTNYVTANPNSDRLLTGSEFGQFVEVWKTEYNEDAGTTLARSVTNHAINVHRQDPNARLMAHYMQPHFPSVPNPLGFGIRDGGSDDAEWIWEQGKPNDHSWEEIWDAYVENLRYVLDDIEVLLNNIDAEKVVISADHANAFGEKDIWGHPELPMKILREVPWVRTTATDTGSYTPEIETNRTEIVSVNEQLHALGYTDQK